MCAYTHRLDILCGLGGSRHWIWVQNHLKIDNVERVMATNRLVKKCSPSNLFTYLLQLDILLLDIGGGVRILKEYSQSCS